MKKYFSIASALMLALGMGMTSCSNDLDEVVTEQQPEMHKLYLTASVPQTPETRSYVEGVAGSDAIKITGWRDGDVIYGIYPVIEIEEDMGSMKMGTLGRLAFEFNGTTKEFESDLTGVNAEDIKYFIYGDYDFTKGYDGNYFYDSDYDDENMSQEFYLKDTPDNPLQIDVAGNSSKIPMWGKASIQAGQLTTDMQLIDVAFLCLHNSSSAPIDVIIARYSSEYSYTYVIANESYVNFDVSGSSNKAKFKWSISWDQREKDKANATVTTIGVGEKVYLPIETSTYNTYTVQVFIGDNNTPFASKLMQDFVSGKIYKLNYTGQ